MTDPRDVAELFLRVSAEGSSGGGCWLFNGSYAGRGYGVFRRQYAHRLAYEYLIGPIPPGMSVLHRCDTPRCVRPDHLFLGTHSDNMDDMKRKGRALKETCKRGHPLRGPGADVYQKTQVRNGKVRRWVQCRACRTHQAAQIV